MAGIFISYRRKESAGVSGRIFDRLSQHFGAGAIFMDVDSIPIGQDYREQIGSVLSSCAVVVAVVGPQWAGLRGAGERRIDDPTDLVRLEIEGGLKRNIPVVPVLIDNASMPAAHELPESLRSFAYRNATEVDSGKDFHVHMDRLIRAIEQTVVQPPKPGSAAAGASPGAAPQVPVAVNAQGAFRGRVVAAWAAAAVAVAAACGFYAYPGLRGFYGISTPILLLAVLFAIAVLVMVQATLEERHRPPDGKLSATARLTISMLFLSMAGLTAYAQLDLDAQDVLSPVVGFLSLGLVLASVVSLLAQLLRARRRT